MASSGCRTVALDTLLIANRGEVALRVQRTARRLGLRTVAVFSDADRDLPHVREADRAVRIGPAPAIESYLCIDAVLGAAEREGADCVHPGYGFLSESAEFARRCEAAGLVFVGPSPEVIELMGRKDRARKVARAAGAPVMPAVDVDGTGTSLLAGRVAAEVGFPALVKAVAGGGGKGMRVARDAGELGPALAAAAREAASAFGDAALTVERYVPAGRHLEVQLVGDGRGTVLHLWDRDCSAQRRHQKIVEEAPASVNPEAARAAALAAAVRIGAHVNYRSLGTVEFLAVGDEIFFLEMNTRLQVEHTVTEAVTGLDMVELQLRLAAGEPLLLRQEDVVVRGHAIEARVYAEDADHGFLPQAGRATTVRWPAHARVDTALESGQDVGTFYDPMLAKVVAHGASREAARRRLIDALDDTAVFGLTTNLAFLRRLVASRHFSDAGIDTSWLDQHGAELGGDDRRTPTVAAALFMAAEVAGSGGGPFASDGWRVAGPAAPTRVALAADGHQQDLSVHGHLAGSANDGQARVVIEGAGGGAVEVRDLRVSGDQLVAELDGRAERFTVVHEGDAVLVSHRGACHRFDMGLRAGGKEADGDNTVVAPLPGTLTAVNVTAGERVGAGQVLGTLESMKMEYTLTAPRPGTVVRVGPSAGSQVDRGDVLFELEAGQE
jgi:3-methylcrotonyl-CoA carboxylase alpha subunit/acetyl-CoA/propionyl-CoA carboxylase biotin carboxyl carrier protein